MIGSHQGNVEIDARQENNGGRVRHSNVCEQESVERNFAVAPRNGPQNKLSRMMVRHRRHPRSLPLSCPAADAWDGLCVRLASCFDEDESSGTRQGRQQGQQFFKSFNLFS